MNRIRIQSRIGNAALAVIGATYAAAATALLIFYMVDVWASPRMIDRLLQFGLLLAALIGVYFVLLAKPRLDGRFAMPFRQRLANSRR